MSVAVWYSTSGPVSRDVGERLIAEATAASPLIWYEPIKLRVDDVYPTVVRGWSKCPPTTFELEGGIVRHVSESDWSFMDYWDSRQLFNDLSAWSIRYRVDWILTVESEKIGKIREAQLGPS